MRRYTESDRTLLAGVKYRVTTLEIDKNLLQEALDLSHHLTPTTLIEAALREYIQRRKQLKIVELFGTIDYIETKAHRNRVSEEILMEYY